MAGTEDAYSAEPFVPRRGGLPALREAAAGCRGCPLHRDATQTVFGAGKATARVMLVGEQPGDQEDRQGRPFVGPAGHLLDRALAEAGLDPADAYVTNAVKHFKFTRAEPRKRRIHKAPTLRETTACGITPFTELNVLQIVFMAAVAGIAALQLGEKAQPILNLSESVLELLQKALWWVIRLAPLGTVGLIGKAIATYGWDLIGKYATFTADIYVGCALVMFVVYPTLLATVAKASPLQFFKGAWPAIQLAFVSRSSVGTMPLTQKVTERLGVPKEYASFAVPFGATTKMDGCAAIYPAIAAIFVAQIFDIQLGVGDYLLIAFVSVVGSAATAGLTGATVMLTLTLSTLGLPMEGVGLLLAIDPILDMMRTATNVAGQALVPVIVSAREGLLDRKAYDEAHASPIDEPERQKQDAEPVPVAA
ncbi:C4-dicarboxylate transport protein [Streptomyces violaceorubidus]